MKILNIRETNKLYILKIIIYGFLNNLLYWQELKFDISSFGKHDFKEFFWENIITIEKQIEKQNLNNLRYKIIIY